MRADRPTDRDRAHRHAVRHALRRFIGAPTDRNSAHQQAVSHHYRHAVCQFRTNFIYNLVTATLTANIHEL